VPQSDLTAARSPFLTVEEVAARERCSVRRIHELTRTGAIPHFRLPGSRRCLFKPDELEKWEAGAELEMLELRRGGRIVRPIKSRTQRHEASGRQ
jgi:excisionase family DNA binding protein